MRLISWNLNGRRSDVQAQVSALDVRAPDVVALQEIMPTTVVPLRSALHEVGLTYITDSFALSPASFVPAGPRRYGLMTASRYELHTEAPGRFRVPWPERVLSVAVLTRGGRVEVHNTHVPPGSSNGWVKIAHLEGLYGGLARPAPLPRVLCGDFNTPQMEFTTG
jgi:endonuclease/exonuclease/phosphatase family metal-dependent hydrolase